MAFRWPSLDNQRPGFCFIGVSGVGNDAKEQLKEREIAGLQRSKTPGDRENEPIVAWTLTLRPCAIRLRYLWVQRFHFRSVRNVRGALQAKISPSQPSEGQGGGAVPNPASCPEETDTSSLTQRGGRGAHQRGRLALECDRRLSDQGPQLLTIGT